MFHHAEPRHRQVLFKFRQRPALPKKKQVEELPTTGIGQGLKDKFGLHLRIIGDYSVTCQVVYLSSLAGQFLDNLGSEIQTGKPVFHQRRASSQTSISS